MKESKFQAELISEIKRILPGCIVMKNDANYLRGVPDLLILYGSRWAALEVKQNKDATHQPLQDYYVKEMDAMSYASFIFPENKEDILNELLQALRT